MVNKRRDKKGRPPPAVFSDDPQAALEQKLRENPKDQSIKVDVGSDESMDASDPPSVVLPEHGEPVPSSSFESHDNDSDDSEKT